MPMRRPSSATAFTRDDDDDLNDGLGPRPSSYAPVRPSMIHDEFMKEGRPRSLSSESDAAKPRPSVPLLYASAVSSMSTLSSTFYQYDSTDGAPTPIPTPSSIVSSDRTQPSRRGQQNNHSNNSTANDPPMRLPAAQERQLIADARHMTKELIVEHLRTMAATRKHVPLSTELIANVNGMSVFAHQSISGKASKKPKRYMAQWRVNATIDEVMELLKRDDDRPDLFNSYQSALYPEIVHCKTLWKGNSSQSSTSSGYNLQLTVDDLFDSDGEDDGDLDDVEDTILSVAMDEVDQMDDITFFDRGRGRTTYDNGPHRKTSIASSVHSKRSRPGSKHRRRAPTTARSILHTGPMARPSPAWLGVNWWVQHMPGKLSRDRDFVVLEKQSEFVTSESQSRRGFVHLRHSVDLADVSQKMKTPFVRGYVAQCGLVAVESSGDPGVILLSQSMEMDFAGHVGGGQHRQILVKRLLQMEKLEELLWQQRLLKSQLLWTPQLNKSSDKKWNQCEQCHFRSNRFSRKALASCKVCARVMCNHCSEVWQFMATMVEQASHRGRPLEAESDGSLRARVCTKCVQEYSRPQRRQTRSQPVMSVAMSSKPTVRDSEYSQCEDERDDGRGLASLHFPPQPSYHPTLKRAETWDPSRSSRIAEELVDDFLSSLSPEAESVMPQSSPEEEVESEPAPVKLRRPSMMLYDDVDEPPPTSGPRRKLSIFELIPEPAPRKNVVLYEC